MATRAQTTDPARLVTVGTTMLAASVLSDSAMEHYRGSFRNPAMVLPLAASAASLALDGVGAGGKRVREVSHMASVAIGLTGLGFHAFNVGKRLGGMSFTNLFYGAPVGAPGALVLTGITGALADGLRAPERRVGMVPVGSGRIVGTIAAAGIMGTVAEAALLHFRGAYHDPFMWLPVTIPPLAAAALAVDVVRDRPSGATRVLLGTTFVLGIMGVGFHAFGVARNMGGWRNMRQNVLAGPPIPAPPAFTGLALVGMAALALMGQARD